MSSDPRQGIVELLPRLRRFAYALTSDPDKGDDLVQEGCLRAFARLDQWQPGTRLDSWMFRIIHNIWIDQKRALKVRGTQVNLDDAPELTGSDGRDETEHRLTLNRVLESMDRLPAEHRELIALISIEGVSYQEAAAILDIPLGTVTSRLVRARRALHAMAIEGVKGTRSSSPEGGSASNTRSSSPEGGSASNTRSSSPEGGSGSNTRSSSPEGGSGTKVEGENDAVR